LGRINDGTFYYYYTFDFNYYGLVENMKYYYCSYTNTDNEFSFSGQISDLFNKYGKLVCIYFVREISENEREGK